jgi:hypothetical protein
MKLTNEVKISLITAVCILALAIISKNVLNVQLDFIPLYGPVWVYIAYIITKDKAKKSKPCGSSIYWSLAIIIVTIAILALYAI